MAIRVLLVDNQTLVRAGIRSLLAASIPVIEVVGEAADGREALRLAEEIQPDVVLMDVAMRGLNGLEATSRLVHAFPRVRVIMLSVHADEEYVIQALRAGAAGYMLKDSGITELELAIKAVAAGDRYLSPAVSKRVLDDYMQRLGDAGAPLAHLTPRQREILQLIAEGNSTKEIAGVLGLSVKTVETHRAQLMSRLDIHDVAGLVRYAVRVGLVTNED